MLEGTGRDGRPITRLTIDVTETLATGKWTGIERVVRRLAAELRSLSAAEPPVRLVAAISGRFHELNPAGEERLAHPGAGGHGAGIGEGSRFLARALRLAPWPFLLAQAMRKERRFAPVLRPLVGGAATFGPGDLVLLLDSYWAGVSSIQAAGRARRTGARVVSAIYDLIPVTHPEYMTPFLAVAFPRALLAALRISDGAVAISRASAAELRHWLGPQLPSVPIKWFHLGNDPTQSASATRTGTVRHYAAIGTIEPRKGHDVILDAFERRWAAGDDCQLTIVGRMGWAAPAMRERVKALAGERRFRLVHDADDARLAAILTETDAIIMASRVEGFGLPIVEALALDIPVIASDIAVFREIGGDALIPFEPGNGASLVDAMKALEADPERYRALARAFAWLSWNEAARRLVGVLKELPA